MEETSLHVLEKDVLLTGITPKEREFLYYYFAGERGGGNPGRSPWQRLTAQICKFFCKLSKALW